MIEDFCNIFLVSFLVFYSALVLVLLGKGIRRALRSRLKRTRRVRMAERLRALSFSPQTPRN